MKVVHLITMPNIQQGYLLKDLLENEGIEVVLNNEATATMLNAFGVNIDIEVLEKDYEKALQILKESFPDSGY